MYRRETASPATRHSWAFALATSFLVTTVLVSVLTVTALMSFMRPWLAGWGSSKSWRGPLYALDGTLVDSAGCVMHVAGVNWFGFETRPFAPHGLDVRSYQSIPDHIAPLRFNTLPPPDSNSLL